MEKPRSPFASHFGIAYLALAHSRTRRSRLRPARHDRSDVLSPAPQPQYTWSVQDCQPHSEQVFAREELTPTEKKFADAQDAFLDHVGRVWSANLESQYRKLIPGTVRVELSTSPEGELVKTSVL